MMPAARSLLPLLLAAVLGLGGGAVCFAQPQAPKAEPLASAPASSRAPERAPVLPTARAACVKENESCAAANAKCCPGLVCVGVRASFCAPSP